MVFYFLGMDIYFLGMLTTKVRFFYSEPLMNTNAHEPKVALFVQLTCATFGSCSLK